MYGKIRESTENRIGKQHSIFQRSEGRVGQGIVEFAIAIPVVLIVILGTIEFGRLLITHTAISSASREAARYGAAVGNEDLGILPPYEDCVGIRDAAQRVTKAFVDIQDAEIDIEYDKGPGTAVYSTCSPPSDTVELGDRIVVSITTTYEPLIPLGFGSFEVSSVTKRSITKALIVN